MRGRQDRLCLSAGVDEPACQLLVRPRQRRLFAEPVVELTRRATRERPESVQPAQLGEMFVPGLGPHRVVGEVVPVQVLSQSIAFNAAWCKSCTKLTEEAVIGPHAAPSSVAPAPGSLVAV